MDSRLKNVLAILAGIIIGIFVNYSIVGFSATVIPLPEGIDPTNPDSIADNIHLFQAKHFVMPFLAHALGTLVGAYVSFRIAANHNMKFALGIGAFFLLGGITAAFMIKGAPMSFIIIDLLFAYIPMAFIGGKLAEKTKKIKEE